MKDYHILWWISCQWEGRAASSIEALQYMFHLNWCLNITRCKQKDIPQEKVAAIMCQKSFLFFGNVFENILIWKHWRWKKPFFQHIYQNVTKPSAKSVYCFTLEVATKDCISNNTAVYCVFYHLSMMPSVTTCLKLYWSASCSKDHAAFQILWSDAGICNCVDVWQVSHVAESNETW